MRDDRPVARGLRHAHGVERLRQRADLVEFDEQRVADPVRDAARENFGVRHEDIVADEQDLLPKLLRQRLPALPVALGQAVLDRGDRVRRDELRPVPDHPVGRERLLLALQDVLAALVELRRGGIEREHDVPARLVPRGLDGRQEQLDRFLRRGDVGRKAPLVAHARREPLLLEDPLQRVKDLDAGPQGLGERREPDRADHELLGIEQIVGVRAAIDDVHERNGKRRRPRAADVAIERKARGLRGRPRDRQRHAEHRVGAQAPLVRRPVELDEHPVDQRLVARIRARELLGDLAVDVRNGLPDSLAAVAFLVAVAQLERFPSPGRRSRGNAGAADGAPRQEHLDLDGRISARVQDLAPVQGLDRKAHCFLEPESPNRSRKSTGFRGLRLAVESRAAC